MSFQKWPKTHRRNTRIGPQTSLGIFQVPRGLFLTLSSQNPWRWCVCHHGGRQSWGADEVNGFPDVCHPGGRHRASVGRQRSRPFRPTTAVAKSGGRSRLRVPPPRRASPRATARIRPFAGPPRVTRPHCSDDPAPARPSGLVACHPHTRLSLRTCRPPSRHPASAGPCGLAYPYSTAQLFI